MGSHRDVFMDECFSNAFINDLKKMTGTDMQAELD